MVEFAIVLFVKQVREERIEQTLDNQRKSEKNICPTTLTERKLNKTPSPTCSETMFRKICTLSPGLQDPSRLQPEDLQQPGVRRAPLAVGEPGLRGGVPADEDVHHQVIIVVN